MKTWHLLALGVAAFAVARAVNEYRASHYPNPGPGNGMRLTWLQGLEGVVGLGNYPSVLAAPKGGVVSLGMLATSQPSAGQSGLPDFYTNNSGIK